MKKASTEIEKTQTPATGAVKEAKGHDVDAEVAAMNMTPKKTGGHGQGGQGH